MHELKKLIKYNLIASVIGIIIVLIVENIFSIKAGKGWCYLDFEGMLLVARGSCIFFMIIYVFWFVLEGGFLLTLLVFGASILFQAATGIYIINISPKVNEIIIPIIFWIYFFVFVGGLP